MSERASSIPRELQIAPAPHQSRGRARAFEPLTTLPTSLLLDSTDRICRRHIGLPPLPSSATDLKAATRAVFGAEIAALLAHHAGG